MDNSAKELECSKRTAARQREDIEVRVTSLERALKEHECGHSLIRDNDAKTMFHIGLPTFVVILALFK